MRFKYICNKCKSTETIDVPSSEEDKNIPVCINCGIPMRRDWRGNIAVSDECKAENIEETSWLKERMKIRPSGRTKALW